MAVIYRGYASMLHHVASHIVGSREDAEDVVHDVFCKLPWVIGPVPEWAWRMAEAGDGQHSADAISGRRGSAERRGCSDDGNVWPSAGDEIALLSLDHADELRRALAQLSKPTSHGRASSVLPRLQPPADRNGPGHIA
jgi:hypothetical protein